jgi:hypothetical protein
MNTVSVSQQQKNTNEWWSLAVLMIVSTAFYYWYGWGIISGIVQDQGWFLQVSSRVAQGDVLYRDVLWAYGPLPVLLMSWLMRLGRHDIAYYSAMNIVLAMTATLVLYLLHRLVFSPRGAVIAVLVGVFGFGVYGFFLRTYTPGVSFGVLAVLTVLLGITLAVSNRSSLVASILVAIGVAVSCLSKPEFAFASCGLGTLTLLSLWRVRIESLNNAYAIRSIFWGMLIGLGITVGVYGSIANIAGWENVWAGVTGYDQLQWIRNQLLGYQGLISWAKIVIAMGWIFIFGIDSLPIKPNLKLGLAGLLSGFNVIAFIVVYSGWISQVRIGQISLLDLSGFISSVLQVTPDTWVLAIYSHLALIMLASILILFVWLSIRWALKWFRGESVALEQWIGWVIILFVQLAGLRFVFWGNMYILYVIFLFGALWNTQFEILSLRRWNIRLIVVCLLLCAYMILVVTRFGYNVMTSAPMIFHTSRGDIVLSQATREFLDETLHYINDYSQLQDSIVVLGPFPGIYYLSGRQNPLRQDYQIIGVGENASDAQDFLDRLERFAPPILLSPENGWNLGILRVDPDSESAWIEWSNQPAFRQEASRVEKYILDHYQFDRMLGSPDSYQLAAFRRVR